MTNCPSVEFTLTRQLCVNVVDVKYLGTFHISVRCLLALHLDGLFFNMFLVKIKFHSFPSPFHSYRFFIEVASRALARILGRFSKLKMSGFG